MGYKIKDKTIREEVEENLVNKFNSFGLSISFDPDEETEEAEKVEQTIEKNESDEKQEEDDEN